MTSAVAQTTAEADGMAAAATKFEDVNTELQQMLRTLMTQLSGLNSSWKGLGAQAFENVRAQYELDLQKINKALSDTALAIRESSKGYVNTDTDAASRVSGAGGSGLSLPL